MSTAEQNKAGSRIRQCIAVPEKPQLGANQGFTIIEMFIALATLAILLAVSIPGFRDTVDDVNSNSRTKELLTSLRLARSEAIKRGGDIHLCASNNGGTDCLADQWSLGWIVFEDANGDADGTTGSIDAGDEIIRVVGLGRNPALVTSSGSLVTFNSMGFNAAGTPEEFEILPKTGLTEYSKCIQITAVGRTVRTEGECP